MRAHNVRGWSSFSLASSSYASVRTEPAQMPAPVSGSGTSETSLQVSWSGLSSPQDGDSTVTSYNLQWDNGTAGLVYYDLVGVAPYTTVLSYTVTTGVVPS